MIKGYGDKGTEDLFNGAATRDTRKLPSTILKVSRRKLDMLNAASALNDLKVPPANRLESLKGNYRGFHSIRINDQFRLIFRWENGHAYDVEIVDYH